MWYITIEKCPECGGEHKDLEFNGLPNPPMVGGKMRYLIGQCPVTLGQIFKDSVPFPARLAFGECVTKEDYERILATLPGADVSGYLKAPEYVQAVKERDDARAQMLAMIGALQELSMDPEVAGVPLYILQAPDKPLIVEPRAVKNLFYALERHAKTLLPFGKEALNKAYKYDSLLLRAKDLQAEVDRLKGAVIDAKEPAKTIDGLRDAIRQLQESLSAEKGWTAKYRDAYTAHVAEIENLRATIERLEARRTCVHVNVAGDCSVAAKNRKLEAAHLQEGKEVAVEPLTHKVVNLTYFKTSGKYYSSGSFTVASGAIFWDVVTQVRCMLEDGRLPGLAENSKEFIVHMMYDGLPHILVPKEK